MGILSPYADECIKEVWSNERELSVRFCDGRTITVPLWWYPRLERATQEQRDKWESCGGGYGIHWEEIDEDISAENLLKGQPAPEVIKGRQEKTGI
jgi:Protein of unknown function (DUF2442)